MLWAESSTDLGKVTGAMGKFCCRLKLKVLSSLVHLFFKFLEFRPQVINSMIDYIRFDLSPSEICQQARFHHQWLPDQLFLEQGEFDINIMQDLISRGHNIKEREPYGDLNLIEIDSWSDLDGSKGSILNTKYIKREKPDLIHAYCPLNQ